MKKLLSVVLLALLILTGCQRKPLSVTFYNITGAKSTDATVDIKFGEENDYKDSYVDILIKPSEDNLSLKVKKEYTDFSDITLEKSDTWYSLTVLINRANGITTDGYEKYQEVSELIYIFNSSKDVSVNLKAINGAVEEATGGGYLLVNWKDISKEFKLDIKAKQGS